MTAPLGLPPPGLPPPGLRPPDASTRLAGAEGAGPAPSRAEGVAEPSATGFGDLLGDLVKQADTRAKEARGKADDLAAGRSHDIHGTMIAVEQAGISMRLLGSVRNRALEAYREIMRMGA